MMVDGSCIPGAPSRANAGATSSSIAAATQRDFMKTPRLPMGERAVRPSLRHPWRAFGHGLDEGELLFVDAYAQPGSIIGPHFAVLALEEFGHVRHWPIALVVLH